MKKMNNMINEGVYRSPKWLRNFLDFEVHTGEDIKGKVSKADVRREWERRWNSMDRDKFEKFYASEFPSDYRNRRSCLLSSDFREIHDQLFGNFEIWTKYDAWLQKDKQREEEQAKIKQELEDLYNSMIRDFQNSPYSDKLIYDRKGEYTAVTYKFENGKHLTILVATDKQTKIEYEGSTYTVSIIFSNKFVSLINEMNDKKRSRPGRNTSSSGSGYSGYKSSSGYSSSSGRKSTSNKWSGHPKGNLYQTLKDTITQRKEQLKKMSKNDPERKHLENELATAERKLREMNDKYKFEKLCNFESFRVK